MLQIHAVFREVDQLIPSQLEVFTPCQFLFTCMLPCIFANLSRIGLLDSHSRFFKNRPVLEQLLRRIDFNEF